MKVKLDTGAYMPERAHGADAGYDLRTPCRFVVAPFTAMNGAGSATIDTGIHVEIPHGCVGLLKSKSGLNVHHNIIGTGVIDEGFNGSIVVKLYNLGPEEYIFQRGDKIIQLLIQRVEKPDVELVTELEETERSDQGFGSSGR